MSVLRYALMLAPVEPPPRFAESAASDTPAPAENSSLATKTSSLLRVLVVDDEPLIRWAVAETLAQSSCQVLEAGDGDSAMCALKDSRGATDVVLLDLRLPDVRDLTLLAEMRRLAPTTPIVLMTAYGTPQLVDEARRLGAFTVLGKPFEMSELAPLVQRAAQSRRH